MGNVFSIWFASLFIFIFPKGFASDTQLGQVLPSFDCSEEHVSDQSLVLPDDEPEKFVSMTGKLVLRRLEFNSENSEIQRLDHATYYWVLKLEPQSFLTACKTPVRASFQTPATIGSFENCNEMMLTGSYDEKWLYDHVDQIVTVQGYLWHAHTAHHHTPIMLDNEPWFK